MSGGINEDAASENQAGRQEENDGREIGEQKQPVEWDLGDAQDGRSEVREEGEACAGENEGGVVLIERWIRKFTESGNIDGGVFGEGMISVDEQDGESEKK